MTTLELARRLREIVRRWATAHLASFTGDGGGDLPGGLRDRHLEVLVQQVLELHDEDLEDHLEHTADAFASRFDGDDLRLRLSMLWQIHEAPAADPRARSDPSALRSWAAQAPERPTPSASSSGPSTGSSSST